MSASRPRSGEPVVLPLLLRLKRLILGSDARRRGRRRQREWDAIWADERNRQPWMDRGVAREIVDAVTSGWFSRGSRSIDIGCGEGELSGYLAEQGFTASGIDISPAAIERANRKYGRTAGASFAVHDICASPPTGGPFDVVVDRGCLHQMALADRPAYRRHLLEATRTGARMMLFVRAFRDGVPFGDPAERESLTRIYGEALGPLFRLERTELTYLDTKSGTDPGTALGGLVFWFERTAG
jgi:SAM-dependent methyltransferase